MAAALCVAALGWVFYASAYGPVHKGKRMRHWVQQLYAVNQPEVNEAADIFLELGEEGVPWLIQDLEKTAESGPSQWIEAALAKLPWRFRRALSPQVELVHAKARILDIIIKLGPRAARAAGAVGKTLHSTNHRLNSMAGDALAAIGAPAAIPEYRKALQHTNFYVSNMALASVCKIGTNAAALLPEIYGAYHRDGNLRPRATMALAALGPYSEKALEAMLMTNDMSVVKDATYALSHLQPGFTNFVPRFLELRDHPNEALRYNAYAALANVANVSRLARAEFAKGLKDPATNIRKLSLRTLAMYPREGTNHFPELERLLGSEDAALQIATLNTLALMGRHAAPATDIVARLAAHPHREIAEPAARALQSILGGSQTESGDAPGQGSREP